MEKYGKISFNDSIKLINYFNGVEGSDKELISVCVIAPTLCDSTYIAFYRNKENILT